MAHKKEDGEQPQEQGQEVQQAPETQEEPVQETVTEQEQQGAYEQLEAQLKEEQDRHLRLMAEFDNYRRRTQKERESIYPDAVANTLKELLPLLDNFQRALDAPCADEEYKKGVQMTYNSFLETLHKLGVCEFGTVGEVFNPSLHNAVMHIEDESLGKNVLSQVLQCGYRIGEKVLRYAMVQTAN